VLGMLITVTRRHSVFTQCAILFRCHPELNRESSIIFTARCCWPLVRGYQAPSKPITYL